MQIGGRALDEYVARVEGDGRVRAVDDRGEGENAALRVEDGGVDLGGLDYARVLPAEVPRAAVGELPSYPPVLALHNSTGRRAHVVGLQLPSCCQRRRSMSGAFRAPIGPSHVAVT